MCHVLSLPVFLAKGRARTSKGFMADNLRWTSSLSKFLVTSYLEEASTWFGISEKIKSQVFFRLFLLVFLHAFHIALLLCVTLSSIEDAHGQVYDLSVIHS